MNVGTESERGHGWFPAFATAIVAVILFCPFRAPGPTEATVEVVTADTQGALIALVLAAGGFWLFRRRFWSRGPHEASRLNKGVGLFVLQSILLRAVIEVGERIPGLSLDWLPAEAWLWMPWFFVTGLGVMLLGNRLGILLSLSGALLLYLRADPGPLVVMGSLVSSMAGIVLLRRPTRGRVLRAGGGAGLALGAMAVIQGAVAEAPAMALVAGGIIPVLMGVCSAVALLAVLPLMEWVLGELSDVSLVEHSSGHPLLDQLKEQAPGTWHHSLNVADLAEKAAAAIGARALFCKTAALYHDIGKLKEPGFFAENITGPSPHEGLDPQASAERIIEHVTYGLELARRSGLPKPFREIIAEHHGTSVVRYFFSLACSRLKEGEDPEALRASFTYPGPPPSSRESGIIALADVIEAATRSMAPSPPTEARGYVRRLVADCVASGQLGRCPLTLAELAEVEETFGTWVQARNHHRPQYPKVAAVPAGSVDSEPKVTPPTPGTAREAFTPPASVQTTG